MCSVFIAIPQKKTYEVDMAAPIRTYISCTYSSTEMPTDSDAIGDFNKLRNKSLMQPLDRHESSLEILYRYYDQLCAVEGKLPMNMTQIPIAFKWKDAFERGGLFGGKASLALCLGSYEKACVMFNIAAMQSQVASSQKLDTDDELKLASKLFMQSAGMLNNLKDSVLTMVQQDPTSDLMPDTLNALSSLMLAQAQEAIYLKAAKDDMKPAILAKIAAQAAEYFGEASRNMGREGLRALWDKDWMPAINGKQLAFQALSQFHQSLVAKEANNLAEELSRLTVASSNIQQAQQHLSAAHLGNLKTEVATIQKAYESAKKDNDFIYHERILDPKTLPIIQKAVLAKPQPVAYNQRMSRSFKDLFEKLTPVAVQMAVAKYDTRRSALIQSETGRMREHTNLMNTILASLNLPAALEDATSGQALPESIREKSAKLKSMGGLDQINRLICDLPSLLQRNQEILDETKRLLDDEQRSDDQLRGQFKERWTRLRSEHLTGPLYDELGKYGQILDKAKQADQVVKEKFESNRQGIAALSKTELELKNTIPGLNSHSADSGGGSAAVVQLRKLMTQVTQLKDERERFENELKAKNCDISSIFLKTLAESGSVNNDEQIGLDQLNEIYSPIRTQISDSILRQEKLMSEIQTANDKFIHEKGSGTGQERENMLKMLVNSFDAFVQLSSNLEEGTKFYNDLTPLLIRLQQKVSDYCFARKTEKEDLIKDLQVNIVGQATGQAPSQPAYHSASASTGQPPARPPPPKFQNQHPAGATTTDGAPPIQQSVAQPLQHNYGAQQPMLAAYAPYQGIPQYNQPYGQQQDPGAPPQPYNLSYSSYAAPNQQFASAPGVPSQQPQYSATTPYPTAPIAGYPYPQQPNYGTMPMPQQNFPGQTQPNYNTWR